MGRAATPVVIPEGAHVTYQLQYRKCGKSTCKVCRRRESKGHGPYWYAYWRKDGAYHCKYFGKVKPIEAPEYVKYAVLQREVGVV